MVNCCCVKSCKLKSGKGCKVGFYSFPQDPRLVRKWLEAMDQPNYVPKKYSKICGVHFLPKCFEPPNEIGRRRLKDRAVPTEFSKEPAYLYRNALSTTCAVVGCTSAYTPEQKFRFFCFPTHDKEKVAAWARAINRVQADGSPWVPTRNSRIWDGQ